MTSAPSRRGCGSLPSRNLISLVTTATIVVITIATPPVVTIKSSRRGTRPAVYRFFVSSPFVFSIGSAYHRAAGLVTTSKLYAYGPAAKSGVAGLPWAKARRQIPPRRTRSQHPQDRLDSPPLPGAFAATPPGTAQRKPVVVNFFSPSQCRSLRTNLIVCLTMLCK